MSSLDGFNRVAPWYDALKRLVFGSSIALSEVRFLAKLPLTGDFLIIGGGTGEILNPLLDDRPTARVWYVEASSTMLARTRENISSAQRNHIEFIHGTEAHIPANQQFDGVITNFFLDLFPDERLTQLCSEIEGRLKENSIWLVTDFSDQGKMWQKLMLWVMYRFFRLTSSIQATRLPQWEKVLRALGMRQVDVATFYGNFIKSCTYKKEGRSEG